MGWLFGMGGVSLAACAFYVAVLQGDIENLEASLANSQEQARLLAVTNRVNRTALDACRVVNAENALARDQALDRADAAERSLAILREEANATITIVRQQADTLREGDDGACRALTDPLPGDFVDWVFSDPDL
jgi:hypothetical protein